jgi:hypothetical protein
MTNKWNLVESTPFQDIANDFVKEMKEDDKLENKKYQYKIKMKYGKIKDPSRPLFEIWRKNLRKVV